MKRPRAYPVLLIELGSFAAATVVGWLACPRLPTAFLRGFFDGLGLLSLYGYLPVLRPVGLRQSWSPPRYARCTIV